MKHKKEIYEKMKRRDFGESMCDETKLKVLNFVERQLRLYNVSNRYSIEDIEKCVENWGLCKVEKEYIEKFLKLVHNGFRYVQFGN